METFNDMGTTPRSRAAADSVHQGIDRAAQVLHGTTESAAAQAARLAERAESGVDTLRAKQEEARATTISYATQHPLRTLAISLGVGFVVAKLLGGRSSRRR